MEKGSEKNIAKRNNISTNSVNRILDSICDDKLIKNNGTLPESFGIDELNTKKILKVNMHLLLLIIIKRISLIY